MPPAEGSPVRRLRYTTTDIDVATEVLRARYVEHTPTFSSGDRAGFVLSVDSDGIEASGGALRIDQIRHTTAMAAQLEPFVVPTVLVPLSGVLRYTCGRDEVAGVRFGPMWAPCLAEWDDIDLLLATIDPDRLRRVGAEISGLDPSAVSFTGMAPLAPGLGRFVGATMAHLKRDLLSDDDVMAGALARSVVFDQLATALLVAFPNTTHTLEPVHCGAWAEPATVRRAVAFIADNAHRDIGLTEIAQAARLGVRGLQMAFRRHRDTTPLAYLKRVRMESAHRDLQAADPLAGNTVSAIACRWGFTCAGAFSVDYRRLYGRPPSHTLRG